MDLFFFEFKSGNFGDDLNQWLWDEVLPDWRRILPGHLLIGVGTLINDQLPRGMPKVVMGSGVGYGRRIDEALKSECRFVAVRGPRSAARLGLPPEVAVADPAILVPELAAFRDIPKYGPPIFVPHVSSLRAMDWGRVCARAGIDFVSPADDAHAVIRRLAAAPLVIAESMHAAILADAFRTPWHAISMTPEFNDFKWMDWAESLGIPLHVHGRPWERFAPSRHSTDAEGPAHVPVAVREAMEQRSVKARIRQLLTPLRQAAKERLVVRRFAELARAPGMLSPEGALEDRRAELRRRFAALLETVETASV